MKKIIIAVFAHPDDESFGPAGTLLKEAKDGSDIHLISLTAGEAGSNPGNFSDLAQIRLKEWRQAGDLLGAASMTCLNYADSQLTNQSMVKIGDSLIDKIETILAEAPIDSELEIMSMDLNGITGHIDHIVASRAAHYAFYKLKSNHQRLARLRLVCISKKLHPKPNTDWLFMEAGRSDDEIDQTIDAREFKDQILAVMRSHVSQSKDAEQHILHRGENLGLEHFIIKT